MKTEANSYKDTFLRIEDKYLIPKSQEELSLKVIGTYMEPCYVDDSTQFTLIESVYFDSSKFDLFKDHFRKLDKRYKLRIRRYGPNGVWSQGFAFLESKCKSAGISTKMRFVIGETERLALMLGQTINISPEFRALNSNIEESALQERVGQINEMILRLELVPQVQVRYRRHAFEKDGFRVTFDKDVNVKNLRPINQAAASNIKKENIWSTATQLKNQYSSDKQIIMEVKHAGAKPIWFDEFMKTMGIMQTSFSKYCWGIAHLIEGAGA